MELDFERGERARPRGHAILYFRSASDNDEVWATYLMALPISVDVSKYVPPFLSSQMGDLGSTELSAFAFPPVPEKLLSHREIQRLAKLRDDDVVYGGVTNTEDVTSLMYMVNEIVRRYAEAYSAIAKEAEAEEKGLEEHGYQEVIYSLMSENDRLAELSKLVGKLRYAIDGKDLTLIRETEGEIHVLSRHLPENHQVADIIEAARAPGEKGNKLADLYIRRCYLMAHEEYEALQEVEEQIQALKSSEQNSG